MRNLFGTLMIAAVVMIAANGSWAQDYRTTNKAGGAACFTKDAYDEYRKAALRAHRTKDPTWMEQVYNSGRCFPMERGLRVTVKDSSISGTSQVYLHPRSGGTPMEVWTANENFR